MLRGLLAEKAAQVPERLSEPPLPLQVGGQKGPDGMEQVKRSADLDILTALSGILEMQRTIRRNSLELSVRTALYFLRAYYLRLPLQVSRRLTELDRAAVEAIPLAVEQKAAGEALAGLGRRVAGDAAFAQVIRACSQYRARLGLDPLGPDGRPEKEAQEA